MVSRHRGTVRYRAGEASSRRLNGSLPLETEYNLPARTRTYTFLRLQLSVSITRRAFHCKPMCRRVVNGRLAFALLSDFVGAFRCAPVQKTARWNWSSPRSYPGQNNHTGIGIISMKSVCSRHQMATRSFTVSELVDDISLDKIMHGNGDRLFQARLRLAHHKPMFWDGSAPVHCRVKVLFLTVSWS